jgi:sec-independent protein translocase protein TatA
MFRNPTTDLIVILVIVLLIFGPKRLPGLGKSLGSGIREFKDSVTGGSDDDDEEPQAQITPGTTGAAPGAVAAEQRPADPAATEHRS